ncbi:MAG: penicillin-binding protein 2 [bacterium]
MQKRDSIGSDVDELKLFNARAIVAAVIVLLALLLIVARLVILQIEKHSYYTEESRKNYLKNIPISPVRGQIYDRNGVLLAANRSEYVLEVIPNEVKGEQKSTRKRIEASFERLEKLIKITDNEKQKFFQKMRKQSLYRPILLHSNLTEEEIAVFSVNRSRFPGFQMSIQMERYYPHKEIAGHVVGYVGRIDKRDLEKVDKRNYAGTSHIGKSGIEAFHEDRLHGTTGFKVIEVDVRGRPQKVEKEEPPIVGEDIFLSLDIKLQITAEQLLQGRRGAIVAIDPRNGEVLALASVPMFDPNLFVNGISHKNYNALRNNPGRPLYNRALQGGYPAGSTIKPIVALAGYHHGVVTPSSSVRAPGFFQIPGHRHKYRCWNKRGHGSVNMNYAIAQSCDVYFYDLAYRLGIDKFSKFMNQFGFGIRTGIDLPSESAGLMPTREWKKKRYGVNWYPGDTVNIGIGQGFWLSTPLQLASATATLAMRGERKQPHLLRGVRISKNLPATLIKPEPLKSVTVKSEKMWHAPIMGMINVVHSGYGTAKKIAGAPYKIAGKTGTVQVVSIAQGERYDARRLAKKFHDHSLFVAFAPPNDPQVAIAVIAENSGGGSKFAAPVGRQMLDAAILQRYILPEGLDLEPEDSKNKDKDKDNNDSDDSAANADKNTNGANTASDKKKPAE